MAGILFDRIKTYDSNDPVNFPDNALFITSALGEINVDTRDKFLEPTRGYWLNAQLTGSLLSPVFSDATYFKSLLSGAYITSRGDHIFGVKAKWGTLRVYDGDVPASYRFYAGGMNSNRAYTYRDLGPKNSSGDPLGFPSLLEGSFEYRFPVYEEFRGVLFSDLTIIGNDYIPDYAFPYWGVGMGLRYLTPIGPIAIDVGVDPEELSQYAIHFRIGELF
jgi:translocation and assembly module TamA